MEVSMSTTLSAEEGKVLDAYWRASNYLSVGQIYLYDNPLLKEPLRLEHVKPRLLGHWGTTPGLNFIYVHLNRVIKKFDLNMLYIAGPGHGGIRVHESRRLGERRRCEGHAEQCGEAQPLDRKRRVHFLTPSVEKVPLIWYN